MAASRSLGVRTSRGRRGALVFLIVLAVAVPSEAASGSPRSSEQRLADSINAERRAAGLGFLHVDGELQRVARAWAAVMAREDRLYHNPDLGAQVQRDWRRLGENVGWAGLPGTSEAAKVDHVHSVFMTSADHRAHVLRADFNWVGVGVATTGTGKLYAAVVFMNGPGQPPGEFRDVHGGGHAQAIRAIALHGVALGCTTDSFCPNRPITRADMAVFLARAQALRPAAQGRFTDIAHSPYRHDIAAVAAAGITGGCGQGRYCPHAPVTRGQIASFLQRAFKLPLGGPMQRFSDVTPKNPHREAIHAIARARITVGCSAGMYCPNQAVTRGELATFLARALRLV